MTIYDAIAAIVAALSKRPLTFQHVALCLGVAFVLAAISCASIWTTVLVGAFVLVVLWTIRGVR